MAFAPSPIVTQKHGTDYQTPSLTAIDAAVMQAATKGDVERRNALMTLRVTLRSRTSSARSRPPQPTEGQAMAPGARSAAAPASRTMRGPAPTARRDQPQYRYAGDGRFLPVNDAARAECECWNRWADEVNARTTGRSIVQ